MYGEIIYNLTYLNQALNTNQKMKIYSLNFKIEIHIILVPSAYIDKLWAIPTEFHKITSYVSVHKVDLVLQNISTPLVITRHMYDNSKTCLLRMESDYYVFMTYILRICFVHLTDRINHYMTR